jgi:hypothetical protein
MNVNARRVAKLERGRPPVGCPRCDGKCIGVIFRQPAPGDFEVGPDGRDPPIPPACPRCGRRIPKTYVLENRAMWDAI